MNKITCLLIFLLVSSLSVAQKYVTEKSVVTFFSDAPVEDIAAENKKSSALLEISTGRVAFSIPISDFKFEKHLMQEHFNEKYMETEKFPKSTFDGQILSLKQNVKGQQNVTAKGKLTIHGVTNEVEVPGIIEITGDGKILIKAIFNVKLKDYKITIPQLLWQNIAEEIEVKVDFTFKPKS